MVLAEMPERSQDGKKKVLMMIMETDEYLQIYSPYSFAVATAIGICDMTAFLVGYKKNIVFKIIFHASFTLEYTDRCVDIPA